MKISDITARVIGDKRRWRAYKARTKRLPENYRIAVDALERYLMFFGAADGDSAATMFEDLADLFERAAADGTAIREIVGEDPVDFVEAFIQNYTKGGWIIRERDRLTNGIKRAEEAAGEALS
ncbi:DUF1048 domain-containing protein [Amycolatopsis sp., V23-08]|uniref:DUF1048 domain-containing protein n=1 Tax=Amycolatopsis heterodermiae TaxID=3110235 RepID=A0ABU5R3K8_9PSEU|nr:DUF1048 domain-containing protein [Amycolatopsis sp., V23-08]MEA5360419.1 DUF1048 domain-containing protein [Amycolatopsis sp., V23-08]